MMTNCCAILGLVFLVVTNLCIIISFATPYWLEEKHDSWFARRSNRGLWAYCDDQDCTWVFQRQYNHDGDKIWWIATQALMCFGLALGLLSLLLATMALCCDCKGCNASHAVSGLLMLAFIVMAVAVVTFGVQAHRDPTFAADLSSTRGARHIFSWSFWLGIASAGWALITSFVYCCDGRRHRM